MRRGAALLLALAMAGCGGPAPEPGPPTDEVLERLATSAHRALELEEAQSAATLYSRALERARERDDPQAIADMGFGQATAALGHGDAAGALRVAREVRTELERRGVAVLPRLKLAEATALHRLGRAEEATRLAAEVAQRGGEDRAAALRAQFLLGLIAAGQGEVAALSAARAALAGAEEPAFAADALELLGQEALLRGDARRAAAEAEAAAALRRDALDYRGLSRALALEGAARERLGEQAAAADLLLRAGQGAAQRGEREDARRWLGQAERLARAAGRSAIAADARRGAAALRAER